MKTNLPVILLNGIILLPNNELKLEIDNELSKNIIDISSMFHNNKILIVTKTNPLEEVPTIKELPKFGVIAKISQRLELPNGKVRITLTGISRARIYEYLNLNRVDEALEAILSPLDSEIIDENEANILIKKLKKELDKYIEEIPYISNSIIESIKEENDLSKLTDVIASNLPLDLERLRKYLYEIDSFKRVEMLLEDIYSEFEIYNVEKELDMKVCQNLEDTQREYILREKIKAMKEELGDISSKDEEIDKLRNKLEIKNIPDKIKEIINTEIKRYESLSNMSPEVSNVRNYIDWLLDLPWSEKTIDNEDLKDIKNKLDNSHYGMEEIKTRIIEYLAVKKMTNNLNGPIICLVGPPGVGKTSFVYSIAKAINRNFVKISLGGVHDEAEIRGHRRTYLGANPGRIITSMKKAKSNNPVFLIDEVDKMTSDIKGDPASALLEVLDPEQNKYFSDNFLEVEYDLSNVMFILTANNIENIPEALKDRLEIVEISGYTEYEKLDIAKKHLIPKICKDHGIQDKNIIFEDEAIIDIIRLYTRESGVRELERELAKVVRKIVTSLVSIKMNVNKLNITKTNLKQYLGIEKFGFNLDKETQIGVINGLAYTNYGGDVLPIEVNYYKGTGKLILTGSLGDVMKESATIALSYIKANADTFGINYDDLINNDIHIHVPEGAIKKDGPSAGVTLTTAIISAFTNLEVNKKIAMTGEITLHGNVLAIGGLKEKSIGANRNSVDTIFIPSDNKKDLENLPVEVTSKIHFIPVDNYLDIYEYIREGNK